jgi:3-hydroxyisobutyrate dehydrogenase
LNKNNKDWAMQIKTVGFIGLGNIGKPMASRLAATLKQQSVRLKVYDVVDTAVAELVELGAIACSSLSDFADCQIVSLCVRDDADIDALLTADISNSLLTLLAPDSIVAIHSTVTRDNVLRWHQQAKKTGVELIDAPISGGAQGAQLGTLCIMVGAEVSVFERFNRCYGSSAKKIINTGDVGSGVVFKLANNLMTYAQFSAIAEAMALVNAAALDADIIYQIGEVNGVVTSQMKTFISNREMLAAGCSSDDMAALMGPFAGLAEKDLDHALVLAEQLSLDLEATKTVRRYIRQTFLKN